MGSRIVVMKDGFIQQVASPKDLYESPVNLFVATFIGSPQMNVLTANVVSENGGFALTFGKAKIKLPESYNGDKRLQAYVGQEVLMGIRPESFHDEEGFLAQYPDAIVDVEVDVVEFMGSETYLHMTMENEDVTAKVSHRSTVQVHDKTKLAVDPNKIHLFDKETEKSILS